LTWISDWSAGILPATPQSGVMNVVKKDDATCIGSRELASQAGRQDARAPVILLANETDREYTVGQIYVTRPICLPFKMPPKGSSDERELCISNNTIGDWSMLSRIASISLVLGLMALVVLGQTRLEKTARNNVDIIDSIDTTILSGCNSTLSLDRSANLHSPSRSELDHQSERKINWQEDYSLILMERTDKAATDKAYSYVRSQGGKVAILTPGLMLGWFSAGLSRDLFGKHGIKLVTKNPLDLRGLQNADESTLAAARFFNAVASGAISRELNEASKIHGGPLSGDAFPHPAIDIENYEKNLAGKVMNPSVENSDTLIGTVAIALYFIESNGTIDANTYTWTAGHQQDTYNRVLTGLTWWSSIAITYGITVTFTPSFVSPLTFERIMFNEGEPRVTTSDGQVQLF